MNKTMFCDNYFTQFSIVLGNSTQNTSLSLTD